MQERCYLQMVFSRYGYWRDLWDNTHCSDIRNCTSFRRNSRDLLDSGSCPASWVDDIGELALLKKKRYRSH